MKVEIELSEKDMEDMLTQYLSARNIVAKNAKDIAKRMAKGVKDTKVEAEAPQRIAYPNYSYPWTYQLLTSDRTVYGNGDAIGGFQASQPARVDITYGTSDPNFGQTVSTAYGFSTEHAEPGPVNPSEGFGYDSEGTYTRAANE